jgi:hypothetical protein
LFSEADALFGERNEIKDAHDRANIGIDYFLARTESLDGLVILSADSAKN